MGGEPQGLVLVVEDDPDAREALGLLLEVEGYAVVAAANGQEALDLLRTLPPPHVILLDLMMPVMDGWRFRERQLADPQLAAIPVILVTATDMTQHASGSFEGVPVFVKPVDPTALLARLEEGSGGRSAAS